MSNGQISLPDRRIFWRIIVLLFIWLLPGAGVAAAPLQRSVLVLDQSSIGLHF
jgi:hypothetical protein